MRDVPDVRVLNSENVVLDLDNYVSDANSLAAQLTYDATRLMAWSMGMSTLADFVTQSGGTGVSVTNGVVTLPGVADGSGDYSGFSVVDASADVAYEANELTGVNVLIASPSLTSDSRLAVGVDASDTVVPFYHPVWATSATSANSLYNTRSIAAPRTIGGGTITAPQWAFKLSRLNVVNSTTADVNNRILKQRVVTDAAAGVAVTTSPQSDDNGNLIVSIDGNGNVSIDPEGPFTAGAIVIGVKAVASGDAEAGNDYDGAYVIASQLVTQSAGGQSATGFPLQGNGQTLYLALHTRSWRQRLL
jgi:hypothetical protein